MRRVLLIVAPLLVLALVSCAKRSSLKTMPLLDDETITGKYDVILYEEDVDGTRNAFAILDLEGDPYEFVPSSLGGTARRQRDLPAEEAVERAGAFLDVTATYPVRVRRILREGATIGYELRLEDEYYGHRPPPNLLEIRYDVEGGKVKFRVRALPLMERSPGR